LQKFLLRTRLHGFSYSAARATCRALVERALVVFFEGADFAADFSEADLSFSEADFSTVFFDDDFVFPRLAPAPF